MSKTTFVTASGNVE